MKILCTTATIILAVAGPAWSEPAAAQQDDASDRPLTIEIASARIRGYPLLATAAGQAANRGADALLDRAFGPTPGKSASAVTKRLLRLWLVNMPIAAASATAAHELGHVSRTVEWNGRLGHLKILRWPWPVPVFSATLNGTTGDDELAAIAGGGEAASVQEESLVDHIYDGSWTDYFDWLLLAFGKLEMPAYTWTNHLSDQFPTASRRDPGDPRFYANEFTARRATARFSGPPGLNVLPTDIEYPHVARSIQRGMWLNLADYTLGAAIMRSIQYMVTGERLTINPILKVGRLQFLPGARFSLTSIGLERAIATRILTARRLTRVEVRWIETPAGRQLWAAGVDVSPRLNRRLAATLRADVFERTIDRYGIRSDGYGTRLEVGFEKPFARARRIADVGLRLGFKSRGYLLDAPYKATLLGEARLSVRF